MTAAARPLFALALALLATSCTRSAPSDAPASSEAPTVAPAPTVPPLKLRPPAKIPPFDQVRSELTSACGRDAGKARVPFDAGARRDGGAAPTCLDGVLAADFDKAVAPLRASDVTRFALLTREEATFVAWVDDACALAELASGTDAESRTRVAPPTPGARAACREHALSERDYYVRAVIADDATSLANRVDALGDLGRTTLDALSRYGGYVSPAGRPLGAEGASEAGTSLPRPLTATERTELGTRSRAIITGAHTLAQSTCHWAALAEYTGGAFGCEDELVRYYLGGPAVRSAP